MSGVRVENSVKGNEISGGDLKGAQAPRSFRNKLGVGLLSAITAVAVAPPKEADAQFFHDSSALDPLSTPNALALGAELEGISVWYKGINGITGNEFIFNGTLLNSTTIITSAHTVPGEFSSSQILTAGTSLNFNDPSAGQVANVASWERHPSYDAINFDIAKIILAEPIDLTQFPSRPNGQLPIGTLNVGDTFVMGGRAPFGAADVGLFSRDGLIRAGTTVNSVNGSIVFPDASYHAGQYSLSINDPLNSISVNLMSGSTAGYFEFNSLTGNNEFFYLGPLVGATLPTPAHEGFSYIQRLDLPSVQAFIPEPGSLALLGAGAGVLAMRRRRA